MDAMKVLVEASEHSASDAQREAAGNALTRKIKDVVGVSARVEVGDPGSVERSQGKARRVVDLRPKG